MSLIGRQIGNYKITAKLGEGGMGAVYRGEHPLIGKRVAVKVLLDELASKQDIVDRFFHEAKAVNDIGHQNIVDIVDFGTSPEGQVYFIMEFLDGDSMADRLRNTGFTFPETVNVMKQCCSALQASHDKGIVHRDLKPENIFLLNRGGDRNFVKLLDFGIAKLTGEGGVPSKTRTGLVIGTPAYMSPEQCEGKGRIDHRSDIYSLGCVMYEMLTGQVPFKGEGFGEVLVRQMTEPPAPPSQLNPHVPRDLEAVVLKSLEKAKELRFQSMNEFLNAVTNPAAFLNGYKPSSTLELGDTLQKRGPTTLEAKRPSTLSGAAAEVTGSRHTRPPKSRAPLFAVMALLVLAAAGAGVVVTRGKSPAAAPEPSQPAAAIPAPKVDDTVVVTVKSQPSGARVFRADVGEVGKTPLEMKVKRGAPSFDVLLRLDGYKVIKTEVTTEQTKELTVDMAKEFVPPPTQPVVEEEAPPPEPTRTPKATVTKRAPAPKKKSGKSKSTTVSDDGTDLMQPAFLK
jgi:serine/threonine-protein kinase